MESLENKIEGLRRKEKELQATLERINEQFQIAKLSKEEEEKQILMKQIKIELKRNCLLEELQEYEQVAKN